MTRLRIDPNVRLGKAATYVGFEDVLTVEVPRCGETVQVVEPDSGLSGLASVARVDTERKLIYLNIDWSKLKVYDFGDLSTTCTGHPEGFWTRTRVR